MKNVNDIYKSGIGVFVIAMLIILIAVAVFTTSKTDRKLAEKAEDTAELQREVREQQMEGQRNITVKEGQQTVIF